MTAMPPVVKNGVPLAFVLMLLGAPRAALADGLSGFLEYGFGSGTNKVRDISGATSNSSSSNFLQRYNLAFDRSLYPSLLLKGGGLFEGTTQHGSFEGRDSRSTAERLSPYLELSLRTPFVGSGIGYRRREDMSSANGVSAPKEIQDLYTFDFSLNPSDLPTLSFNYGHRDLYDENRTMRNIALDDFTWSSNYRSTQGLELNYGGGYSLMQDRLLQSENTSLSNAVRAAYSGKIPWRSVTYQTSYNFNIQNSQVSSGSAYVSQVGQQLALITGNVSPTVTEGQLGTFQPLNLVRPQSELPPAVPKQNNIGMSFAVDTEVNTLFLAVTSATLGGTHPSVTSLKNYERLFTWQIYTSKDGVNWSILPAGMEPTVAVGSNPATVGDQTGFVFDFKPGVRTRYIKIVETPVPLTAPFPADINPDSIVAVSLQASTVLQAAPGKSASSSSSAGVFNFNARAQLSPNVSYDLGLVFTHSKTDQASLSTTTLVNNGLSLVYRVSDAASLNGRLTEEFSLDPEGEVRNMLTYNAAFSLMSLPTLTHSLVYGGRTEFAPEGTVISNSIFLNNSAQLYQGLSSVLAAGFSTTSRSTGEVSDSVSFTFGADIVPNRYVTMTLSYQDQTGQQSGGGKPESKTYTRTAAANVTYRPFDALYLTGGYGLTMQDNRSDVTLQNYSIGWAPFRGGDLQFAFGYNEALDSTGNQKTKSMLPSLRWNIRPGATLDISYSVQQTTSDLSGSTDSRALSAHLRIAL
ncbi:discoidin/SUN/FTP domain-containing protein [Citrifermentans bremense]|uniref:hypothetical protein n=1 Tax=Citrifermentans bremense TaxID=60035 RepID=UPI0012EC713D|nr:hypothetical protein [Citrifermentans bremense]